MQPAEIPKIKKEVTKKLNAELKAMQLLNKQWEKDISKYRSINSDLLKWHRVTTENLFEVYDFEELEKAVMEFRENIKRYEDEIWFSISKTNDITDDWADLLFRIDYYTVQTQIEDYEIKNDTKDIISKRLFEYVKQTDNEKATRLHLIDCKLLELFKAETIDWETLAKLVYTDCNL